MSVQEEYTYVAAIKDIIIKNGGKTSLAHLYEEIPKYRKKLPKYWKSVLRNKLYYTDIFVKQENGTWRLKK